MAKKRKVKRAPKARRVAVKMKLALLPETHEVFNEARDHLITVPGPAPKAAKVRKKARRK